MFIEAVIIGIIVGIIRKGRFFRLSYVNFNMFPSIVLSLLLYLNIIVMNLGLYEYSSNLYTICLVGSYISVGVFLIANLEKRFMFIPLIGLSSNLFCLAVNNFKFPISVEAATKLYGNDMVKLLLDGKMKFFIPDTNAVLPFLGNIVPINKIFTSVIVSAGDIIIAFGLILIVQSIMSDKFIQSRSKITFSKDIFR